MYPTSNSVYKMSTDLHALIALGEAPIPLLVPRLKAFLDACHYSQSKYMKVHASICLFDFVRRHADLIKTHIPKFAEAAHKKAHDLIEEIEDNLEGEMDEFELCNLCEEICILFREPEPVPAPTTPPPSSSNAAPAEAPGAPTKDKSEQVEQKDDFVARQLFFAVPGRIYRDEFASDGMKSSVKCLDDGSLLEIRRGEKTGSALEKANRKTWSSWEEWQDVLARF